MSQTDENKPHYLGHRQRLRERYINNGIESLHEHEVVELLLFYAVIYISFSQSLSVTEIMGFVFVCL